MRRSLSIAGIAIGLLLVLAAGLMRWVVAPRLAVLPGDTDTTRVYAGTAAVLFNPAALTNAKAGPVMLTNVPISVVHHTKVLDTKDGNALVSDQRIIKVGSTTAAGVDYRYAVDRTTLGRGSGFSGVVKQMGITFNWPIRTEKKDYTGWVPDTQQTTRVHYVGTATRGGVDTYVYRASTPTAAITDPQLLRQLPQSMPKATLVKLVQGLGLSAEQLAGFQKALPGLPDPVQFAYQFRSDSTYWVAPASGIVVDVQSHEVRTIALKAGPVTVPVASVMDITFTSPAATLAAAAKDARDKGDQVEMVYVTLPLALLAGGGLLTVLGMVGLVVRRRRPPAAPVEAKPKELIPTG